MNKKKLITVALTDSTYVLLIATIICLPFILNFSTIYTFSGKYSSAPHNDDTLQEKLKSQIIIGKPVIERNDNVLTIQYRLKGMKIKTPIISLYDLGYRFEGSKIKTSKSYSFISGSELILLPLFLASQIGFLLLILFRFRKNNPENQNIKFIIAKINVKSILIGLIVGIGLILFGFLHDYIIKYLFGTESFSLGVWTNISSASFLAKVFIIFVGSVIAPICEEIFFRGHIFGSFLKYKYSKTGIVVSAIIFASFHMDIQNFIAYVIFGIVLCYSYKYTKSIITPIIAHSLNNIVVISLLFSGHL